MDRWYVPCREWKVGTINIRVQGKGGSINQSSSAAAMLRVIVDRTYSRGLHLERRTSEFYNYACPIEPQHACISFFRSYVQSSEAKRFEVNDAHASLVVVAEPPLPF